MRVELFDLLGRRVATLFDEHVPADLERAVTLTARGLPSGLYVLRIAGERFTEARQVILKK